MAHSYPKLDSIDSKNHPLPHTLALVLMVLIIILTHALSEAADTTSSSKLDEISLERISAPGRDGFGYRLIYHVRAPIEIFWRFKTDFENQALTTSQEIIEHRIVSFSDNNVVTENRYATWPNLRFLWQTTVDRNQYRLAFKQLNVKDSLRDYHYGTIKLSPAGDHTKVTQIAFFNFVGASLWVKYPWYGGMKTTLKSIARWEQKTAIRYMQEIRVAKMRNPQ
jgi:hypothetical protein